MPHESSRPISAHLGPSRPISTCLEHHFFGIVLLLSIQFCVLHSQLCIQRAPDSSPRQRYSLPITPDSSRQPAVRSEAGGSYRDLSGAIRTENTFFLFHGKKRARSKCQSSCQSCSVRLIGLARSAYSAPG